MRLVFVFAFFALSLFAESIKITKDASSKLKIYSLESMPSHKLLHLVHLMKDDKHDRSKFTSPMKQNIGNFLNYIHLSSKFKLSKDFSFHSGKIVRDIKMEKMGKRSIGKRARMFFIRVIY